MLADETPEFDVVARSPWRVHQNYLRDLLAFQFSPLEDGAMQLRRRGVRRFVQQ